MMDRKERKPRRAPRPSAYVKAVKAHKRDMERPRPPSRVTTGKPREHHFGRVRCADCDYAEQSYGGAKSARCSVRQGERASEDERSCRDFWPKGVPRPEQQRLF